VNVLEWLLATLASTCGQPHRPPGSSEDPSSPSSPPPTSIIDTTQKSVMHSKKEIEILIFKGYLQEFMNE
jgi:hypothetical protein